jgi:catechol 2,3-dioxygenase-like lactoylglutathione lyase family enzyme
VEKFVPIRGLHHWAYRCRDAEETRHFYEDLLGLPLTHFIRAENYVGTSGERVDVYVHIFFEMADGSSLAFFDLGDDLAAEPSPNTPRWCNHMALDVASVADLEKAHRRLEAAGVEVVGPLDHDGFLRSIYFFDPNGARLELTTTTASPEKLAAYRAAARPALDAWTREKRESRREVEAGDQAAALAR